MTTPEPRKTAAREGKWSAFDLIMGFLGASGTADQAFKKIIKILGIIILILIIIACFCSPVLTYFLLLITA